jgi:hypothetical protein
MWHTFEGLRTMPLGLGLKAGQIGHALDMLNRETTP